MKTIRYAIRSAITGEYFATRKVKGKEVSEWTADRARARTYKTRDDAISAIRSRGITAPVAVEEGIWEVEEAKR